MVCLNRFLSRSRRYSKVVPFARIRAYLLLPLLCLIYAWILAGEGMWAYLSPDDVTNLAKYLQHPVRHWVAATVFPFDAAVVRPLGAIWYLALYRVVGIEPFWYHAFCFLLLAINIILFYLVALRIAGSIFGAAIATVLFSYHARLVDLYYSAGTIYDILGMALVLAMMVSYFAGRRGWAATAFIVAAFLLAVATKENAVVTPGLLVASELFVLGTPVSNLFKVRWWMGPGSVCAITGAIAVAFAISQVRSPLLVNPSYQPTVSWEQALTGIAHYGAQIVYARHWPTGLAFGVLVGLLVLATMLRSARLPVFWIVLTSLPVIFIAGRSLYAAYLSFAGVCLLAGALADYALDVIPLRPPVRSGVATAALLGLFVSSFNVHGKHRPGERITVTAGLDELKTFVTQIRRELPSLPKGARILLVDDPFGADDWTPVSALRLAYADQTLTIDRSKWPHRFVQEHDFVVTFRNGSPFLTRRLAERALSGL